jgi:hypothetical protein
MVDYPIQPHSRRCVVSGRELQPGDRFYSVLLDEGGNFIRQDYAAEAWQGPPERAFSFWAGKVSSPQKKRRLIVDEDLLQDCFRRLEGEVEPGKANFRYIVALLLMRRRRLKFEETRQEGGQEILYLRCTRSGECYQVVHPRLTDEELLAVQDEVFQVLGWD